MHTIEERDAQLAVVRVILGGDGELAPSFSLISNGTPQKTTLFQVAHSWEKLFCW